MNLMKELKMAPVYCGGLTMYEGKPSPGIIAHLVRLRNYEWRAVVENRNNGAPAAIVYNTFALRRNALIFIKENAA
jgi:hypothetical protein